MRYRVALVAGFLAAQSVVAPGGPASARAGAPELRSVRLTDANPVTTPGECTQIALTGRVETTGTELTSVTTTARSADGAPKPTLGVRSQQAGTVTAVTDRVRLCGIATRYDTDYVGRYTWTLRVAYRGGVVSVSRSFHLRYRGLVTLDATPEPVRRGGWVTLTGRVHDGWEETDSHPIALFFRPDGSTGWTRQGSMTPRCVDYCNEDGISNWQATTKRRQLHSGVWQAVSARTAYLAPGTRSDRVTVRR
jgi:hypothetical protein